MEQDRQASQSRWIDELLRKGIAAAKAGQRGQARELLTRVVDYDERNAPAWLWLSGVVDSLEDREICLENVLAIEPNNDAASRGLAWVRQQMQQTEAPPPPAADPAVVESPVVARSHTPNTTAAALLYEDSVDRQPQQGWEPAPTAAEDGIVESPVVAMAHTASEAATTKWYGESASLFPATVPEPVPLAANEFDNEYLCPYCASLTEHEDRRCRFCGGQLWIRSRKQEKRSSWLWFAIALQLINATYAALPVIVILLLEGTFIADFLGLSAIPRVALYLLALPSVFAAALALGLYMRWRVVYYLLFVDAVIGVAMAVVSFAFSGMTSGIITFVLAIARFMVVLQLGGDFEWQRSRILFRLDLGLKSAVEFMTRADFYNQQKMWGLAMLHIRSALGLMPDRMDCRLALIVAYIRLKRSDLAVSALEQAKRTAPGDPRLAKVETLLNEMFPSGERAQEMGCDSCGASFRPEEISSLDGTTAQCPNCGSIIEATAADAASASA